MPKIVYYNGKEILTAKDLEIIISSLRNSSVPMAYAKQTLETFEKVKSLYELMTRTDEVPAFSFEKEPKKEVEDGKKAK